jgi:hypothetical protein
MVSVFKVATCRITTSVALFTNVFANHGSLGKVHETSLLVREFLAISFLPKSDAIATFGIVDGWFDSSTLLSV